MSKGMRKRLTHPLFVTVRGLRPKYCGKRRETRSRTHRFTRNGRMVRHSWADDVRHRRKTVEEGYTAGDDSRGSRLSGEACLWQSPLAAAQTERPRSVVHRRPQRTPRYGQD